MTRIGEEGAGCRSRVGPATRAMRTLVWTAALSLSLAPACGQGDESGASEEPGSGAEADRPPPDAGDDAPADAQPADASPGATYPADATGLRELIGDLQRLAREDDRARAFPLADSLRIGEPERFFSELFGAELGALIARDYGDKAERIRELVPLLAELGEAGKTAITVEAFDEPSEGAVGYQARALSRMVEPTPLYSVRLAREGEGRGFHLWSFVHDGERFRWAGKMHAVAPDGEVAELPDELPDDLAEDAEISRDADLPDLLELPRGEREQLE